MPNEEISKEELAQLLKEAEQAHGSYEESIEGEDDQWHQWYAGYILRRLQDEEREG